MTMTILEALSTRTPRGVKAKNESFEIVQTLVKLHMDEIEEAREHGYSWTQIEMACRELWTTDSKAAKIIWPKNPSLILTCIKAIKEGRKLHSPLCPRKFTKASASKKYSIEVTEE